MSDVAVDCLFVTQYYKPELIGSAPYCSDVAEWLAADGRAVLVLTGLPHYPDSKVFPGYRDRARLHETIDGLAVQRLRSWIPARRSTVARIVSEADFLWRGCLALAAGRVVRRPLVLSLCPSILSVALGALATARGGRHVAIVHDIQSGLARGLGMVGGKLVSGAMRWCERALLNRTDLVVVLSEAMRDQLRDAGVTAPIEVVPIWVDTAEIRPLPRGPEGMPTVLYSGNLGRKQGLSQIVALADALRLHQPTMQIVLRGNGSEAERLAAEVAARGLDNVRFTSLVPRELLAQGLAEGDIHVVPQDPQAADFAVPSKVYAIMAAGRPFVTTARRGSPLWRLREASGAFLCASPDQPEALVEAVLQLAEDARLRDELGRRGRLYVEQHMAKHKVLAEFADRLAALNAA